MRSVTFHPMTRLIYIESNPGPEPDSLGTFDTADGFKIRYAVFRADSKQTLGSILLLQGRNEAIEKYFETIGDLTRRGFDVATFDWRGQGGSTRLFF
ncbi:MAG: alpha/beta hydrolase [Ahrensia sp.]|nr:alpha/beta hydrolase [Ahrensia sp.]